MRIIEVDRSRAAQVTDAYLRNLCGRVGAAYAAFRLSSGKFYAIERDGVPIGLAHAQGRTLDAFYVEPPFSAYSLEAFQTVRRALGIRAAVAYPDDYSLLSIAAFERPRIRPLSYIFEYGGKADEYRNPYPPLSKDYMAYEARASVHAQAPFARCELHCLIRPIDCDFWPRAELEKAAAMRRLFALDGGRAVGLLKDVPYAADKWEVGVFVEKHHRRKGIGRALLKILSDLAVDYHKTPIACIDGDTASAALLLQTNFVNTANVLQLDFD